MSVVVSMSPGAHQKFAIFVVEMLDGNTVEYKPCAQYEGRWAQLGKQLMEQLIKVHRAAGKVSVQLWEGTARAVCIHQG